MHATHLSWLSVSLWLAIDTGEFDMSRTALMISQTGGGCRASNYIGFIRRALAKAGYPDVPVISLNLRGFEPNPGFKLTPSLIQHGLYALTFGDILLRCVYRIRPYELFLALQMPFTRSGKRKSSSLFQTQRCFLTESLRICVKK